MRIVFEMLIILFLLLSVTSVHANSLSDMMDTDLTPAERLDLANSLEPIAKLIAVLQYLTGVVVILGLIWAGYSYFSNDPTSKSRTISILGKLIIGSILIMSASMIVKVLGLG